MSAYFINVSFAFEHDLATILYLYYHNFLQIAIYSVYLYYIPLLCLVCFVVPASAPKDVTVISKEGNPRMINIRQALKNPWSVILQASWFLLKGEQFDNW